MLLMNSMLCLQLINIHKKSYLNDRNAAKHAIFNLKAIVNILIVKRMFPVFPFYFRTQTKVLPSEFISDVFHKMND